MTSGKLLIMTLYTLTYTAIPAAFDIDIDGNTSDDGDQDGPPPPPPLQAPHQGNVLANLGSRP